MDLTDASLVNADLSGANCCRANFQGANLLGYAYLCCGNSLLDCRRCNLSGVNAEESNMSNAVLTEANLERVPTSYS